METLLIEVRDQKGMALLRDLEALQIIRVITKESTNQPKAATRFAGKLSAATASELAKHIEQSRDEWDRI